MASQLAQILTNFGNQSASQAGSGIETGVKNFIAMKQQGVENSLAAEKAKQEKTTFDQTQKDRLEEQVFGIYASTKSPEQFAEGQKNGLIPKELKWDNREPFMMGVMSKRALRAGTAGKPMEVGSADSPTGTKIVPQIDSYGEPGKPQKPLVQVSNTQEGAESKEYGKSLVKEYETIRDAAANAQTAIQQYNMAKSIDVKQSGPLEAWKASTLAMAEDMGIDIGTLGLERANNDAAYQGIMQNMVLSKMMAQKGPQTENDAKRMEMTLATIKVPEEARRFLLSAGESLERMKIEKNNFWNKWRDVKGTFNGANKAWSEFRNKTPLIAKNPKSGRPVFFTQYVDAMREVNPDAQYADIVETWQKKYGRTD